MSKNALDALLPKGYPKMTYMAKRDDYKSMPPKPKPPKKAK